MGKGTVSSSSSSGGGSRKPTAQKILSQICGSPYATGLQRSFNAHAESKKSAKVFYLRYKGFKGVKIVRRPDGKLCFEHPDNPNNLIEVTPETFASATARVRQDYELSRGKQPNARMKGMGAKEGFHKNIEANNDAYSPDGKNMHK